MPIMKIAEFKHRYQQYAQNILSGGIESVANFLTHSSKQDKQFRDELTAIYGYFVTVGASDELEVEIGGEKENFDAKVGNKILEVVRAIPFGDHIIRQQVATGTAAPPVPPIDLASPTLAALIKGALDKKIGKHYSDARTLLISVNSEDTGEDDELINQALIEVCETASLGPFESIWIVESGRNKAYKLLPND